MAMQSKKLIFVFVMLLIGFGLGGCSDDKSHKYSYPYTYTGLAIISMSFIDKDNGWIVADKEPIQPLSSGVSSIYGSLFKTTDGGKAWIEIVDLSSSAFSSVFFVDKENGWAAGIEKLDPSGHAGVIFSTHDGGLTWRKQFSKAIQEYAVYFDKLFFTDVDNGWAIEARPSNYGTVLETIHTSDGGNAWETVKISDDFGVSGFYFVDKNIGWALGFLNYPNRYLSTGEKIIFKTIDAGKTWKEIAFGDKETPKRVETFYRGYDGAGFESNYYLDQNIGWNVYHRYVYFTADGGKTWEEQEIKTYTDLTHIQFVDKDNGWIGGEGPLFHTTDGGKTWELQLGSINEPPFPVL